MIELAEEVPVVAVAQPHEEVARVAVAVFVTAAAGPVGEVVEAAVGHAHGVGHALDKGPEGLVAAVVAYALRLELIRFLEIR